MTTLAYKDGVLAADTQSTGGSVVEGKIVKIGKIGTVLYAACGLSALCSEFRDWVKGGLKGYYPTMQRSVAGTWETSSGVIFPYGDTVVIIDASGASHVHASIYADGSGRLLALGAMYAGATAEEAIKIATKWDVYTGGEITTVRRHEVPSAPTPNPLSSPPNPISEYFRLGGVQRLHAHAHYDEVVGKTSPRYKANPNG